MNNTPTKKVYVDSVPLTSYESSLEILITTLKDYLDAIPKDCVDSATYFTHGDDGYVGMDIMYKSPLTGKELKAYNEKVKREEALAKKNAIKTIELLKKQHGIE